MRRGGWVAMVAVALAVAGGACGSDGRGELAGVVDWRCRWNESTLRSAVDLHRAGTDNIIGIGDVTRGDASNALFREFGLCANVRRVDNHVIGLWSKQFQGFAAELSESRDREGRQAALEKMLALYGEVNRYPLKR